VKQVLSALAYLHSQNIIHGEIKPENLMLATKEGLQSCVKIIDFGLTKEFRRQDSAMKVMSFQPYLTAPEVYLRNFNSKIDVWSLGIILYIMLSGKIPFPGNSELDYIGNVISADLHFNHDPF